MHTWADRAIIGRGIAVGGFVATYAYAASDADDGEPDFLSEWREGHRCGPILS